MAGVLPQLTINGLIVGSLYALLGLSWNIIYSTTRIFHFSHGIVIILAAYAAVLVRMDAGAPLVVGLIAAIGVAVLVGIGMESGIYRPFRRIGAKPVTIFIASLGMLIAGENITLATFGPQPRSLTGFPKIPYNVAGITFNSLQMLWVGASALAIWGVWKYLKSTKMGKAIRAVSNNPEMAEAVGINRDKVFRLVFALGSGLAGLAAFLIALETLTDSSMGVPNLFYAFIVTFLGGVGSIPGCVVAGITMGLAENISVAWLPAYYKTMVAFAVLLIVIIVRPTGFFGRK